MNKKIYIDGSCFGNNLKKDSKGGFGMFCSSEEFLVGYSNKSTTNNKMEILALIFSLIYSLKRNNKDTIIFSDSSYVVNAYNIWINNWKKNNWKKFDKTPVLNSNLFILVDFLKELLPNIQLKHIKRELNSKADKLAKLGSEKATKVTESEREIIYLIISNKKTLEISMEDLIKNNQNLLKIDL